MMRLEVEADVLLFINTTGPDLHEKGTTEYEYKDIVCEQDNVLKPLKKMWEKEKMLVLPAFSPISKIFFTLPKA